MAPLRTVVLTLDDALANHATYVAPLLARHGFGATFFVCEFPGTEDERRHYMSWEQISELDRAGFEIGNHTLTHRLLDEIEGSRVREEIEAIESRCAAWGIRPPTSFAYPAYRTSPEALALLAGKGYRFARIGGARAYAPGVDDPLLVPSFSTTGTDKGRVLAALEQARDGKVVVLTIHGVPDLVHPHVNTPRELFEEYVDFMARERFAVIAMRDLARLPVRATPRRG